MQMLVGGDENIRCVQATELRGPAGEHLCLAYKTTTRFLGGGLFLHDDGYVLAVVPPAGGDPTTYFSLTAADVRSYQSSALLPTPLPGYSIPLADYLWGYSFWILLAVALAWGWWSTRHLRGSPRDRQGPTGGAVPSGRR